MKRFICRMLIVAFSCNVLLPDASVFAQKYSDQDYEELLFENVQDRPSPLRPAEPVFDAGIDTPWSMYAGMPAEEPEPTEDNLTGRRIDYDAKDDARLIKRGIASNDAYVRQFLANAPKDALLDWLVNNPLPRDSYQLGMNEYIPGLHVKKTTEKASKAALKSLSKYYNTGELQFNDFIPLLSAPSDDVASFAVHAVYAELHQALHANNPEIYYNLLFYAPDIQNAAIKRLDGLQAHPDTDPSFTPGHRLVQKLAPKQTESADSAELRGMLNLTLAIIHKLYKKVQDPAIQAQMQRYEQQLFAPGTPSFIKGDERSASFYEQQKVKLLNGLNYARTFKERVMGPNDTRLVNADFTALTLITYDGIDGFKRLVDFLDQDNVNLNGRKQQYRLDQPNFPFLQSAFDNLSFTYLPQVSSRETAMDPKEKTKLVNTLIGYVNNGSAPVRVLAMNLLTKMYEETNPKWTRGQGYDKGAAGGPAVTAQTANQVADRLKEMYCRIDQSVESVYGLNSDQMQEMAGQLAEAYRRVRRDPQSYVVPLSKDGRPMAKTPCYVRDVQTRNNAVYAKELSDSAMGFVLSWVAIGGAFQLIGKGVSYTGSLARLANQARKLPAGQRLAFFKGTLQQAKAAQKMARELADIGVKVERVTGNGAQGVTRFKNALTEIIPKGETLGYRITQRLPGGQLKTTLVEGEVVNRAAATAAGNLPVRVAAQKGTLKSVTELAEKYVTKIPDGVSRAAYREAVATENILKAGLEEISASNFQTGYGMNKLLLKDAEGKLYTAFEPIWVDLSNSARMVNNSVGAPLTGKIRLDMLKAVTTPGGILTGTASGISNEGLHYLGTMAKVMGQFAVADVATMPITQAMDGTYKTAPEGSPWYAEVGQYFSNVGSAIMNYDEAAANSLILPFTAAGKGIGWAWDKITRSGHADADEAAKQLANNPYMKKYRQETEKLQKEFETEARAVVALWKTASANPEDVQASLDLDDACLKMRQKYGAEQRGDIASQWELVYSSMQIGQDPFAPQTDIYDEDFY